MGVINSTVNNQRNSRQKTVYEVIMRHLAAGTIIEACRTLVIKGFDLPVTTESK